MGRLLAIEQMKDRKDHETLAKLKEVLNNDPFYGVRQEAASAVSSIHTDDALDALLASTHQPDARVRRSVISAIDGFYRDKAYTSARDTVEHEKNPAILRSSIAALGKYGQPEVHDVLIKFLNSESYRKQLADGAIDAIRSQDDPAYITPLTEALRARAADFRGRGFAGGLDTLAYLARNEEKKDAVREFLLGYVNDKRDRIQIAAIGALGTLGDPKSIAVLQTFANAGKGSQLQRTAEGSVAELRAGRKPVDDFKNLRQEVMDLEKAGREQSKELEDLKKQLAAKDAAPAKSKGKSKTAKKDGS
jgi:aminopeptidase N